MQNYHARVKQIIIVIKIVNLHHAQERTVNIKLGIKATTYAKNKITNVEMIVSLMKIVKRNVN